MIASSDQVEQGEEVDPHEVDEVPVEGNDVDGREELLREVTPVVAHPHPDEDADADDDVNAVDARHHEVDREERARVRRQRRSALDEVLGVRVEEPSRQEAALELVLVFEELDAEEA